MYFFIPTAILFIIGWFVKNRKVTWLISGYNTLSNVEEEKYDIDKLCYYFGNFMYILTLVSLGIAISSFIFEDQLDLVIWIGVGVFLVVIVLGIIFLNTNNRVMKEDNHKSNLDR